MGSSSRSCEQLLSEMTLEEKVSLIAGSNFWGTPAVERLGIPAIKVTDGPNGARGSITSDGVKTACFPAAVAIAATFDTSVGGQIGKALGREAVMKTATTLLGPTICIHRSPLGGRNFESFSEDPLLSGAFGTQYVKGIQSHGVAATLKHYVLNEQETLRNTVNETISERALREIYLRPFEIVTKDARPWAIMTSFPRINGVFCDMDRRLLTSIPREEWKWDGMMMSDWEATRSTAESLEAGLDLEMPGPPKRRRLSQITRALKDQSLKIESIDTSVLRVLRFLERTGRLSGTFEDGPEYGLDLPEHQNLIRQAGREGIVLLKNEKECLPLKLSGRKRIALIGPLVKVPAPNGGGSAMLAAHYLRTNWEAFNERLGSSHELVYAKGATIDRLFPALKTNTCDENGNEGFTATYFTDRSFSADPVSSNSPTAHYLSHMKTLYPQPQALSYTTSYSATETGRHYLSFSALGPSKVYIDGALVHEQTSTTGDPLAFVFGNQSEDRFRYDFKQGHTYKIRIESFPAEIKESEDPDVHVHVLLDGVIGVRLGMIPQQEFEADLLAEAAALASTCDYALVFVGNTAQWEAEHKDQSSMSLPIDGSQDELCKRVGHANANTIVINHSGVPIDVSPWIDHVSAFVQAWYLGQELGNAIADVILGVVSPSGKLPVSWPRKYEDSPCYGNFGADSLATNSVDYAEGVFVGYRHFDRNYGTASEVRYPFGYGLSYTNFRLSEPRVMGNLGQEPGNVRIEIVVTNVGDRAGAEVVQVYVRSPQRNGFERPIKELAGFGKVLLESGGSELLTITLSVHSGAYWDEPTAQWMLAAGEYFLDIGTSSNPKDILYSLSHTVDKSSPLYI